MVQCEMCGAETPSPKTVKVEGAELQVCDECADFGTEVRDESTSSSSTKYSTSSSGSSSSDSTSSVSDGSADGSSRRRDMFDEMDELVADYDERIREAREDAGMSQQELAKSVSEKASLIQKLEGGNVLPSDTVQKKLESELDITLTQSAGDEDGEWSSESAGDGLTLGDMVKRKD